MGMRRRLCKEAELLRGCLRSHCKGEGAGRIVDGSGLKIESLPLHFELFQSI